MQGPASGGHVPPFRTAAPYMGGPPPPNAGNMGLPMHAPAPRPGQPPTAQMQNMGIGPPMRQSGPNSFGAPRPGPPGQNAPQFGAPPGGMPPPGGFGGPPHAVRPSGPSSNPMPPQANSGSFTSPPGAPGFPPPGMRPGMPPHQMPGPPGSRPMPPPGGMMPPPPGGMMPPPPGGMMPPPPGGMMPPPPGGMMPPPPGGMPPPFRPPGMATANGSPGFPPPAAPFARPGMPPPGSGMGAPFRPPGPGMSGPPSSSTTYNPPAQNSVPTRSAVQNKIDPSQIPRPSNHGSQETVVFETRENGAHAIPPPSTSSFIVKDMGDCSPRFMRATLNSVPHTNDLLNHSSMPFGAVVCPMGLPDPADDAIPIVDFGETGPIRCSRCKAYINPYMRFTNGGKSFSCNFCNYTNTVADHYFCYMGPDGRRRDADQRPELCKGTVEFVATQEYLIRPTMPVVHLFVVDVSFTALSSGVTGAACSAIEQILDSLQGGDSTLVGIVTYDSTVHFYSLQRDSPQMMVMSDVTEPYAPLSLPLLNPIGECKEALAAMLQTIPTMFGNSRISESCSGAAIEAAIDALKPTGGKLHVFISSLPTVGVRVLKQRDTSTPNLEKLDKEKQVVLTSQDNTYKTLAATAAEHQICVDLLFLTSGYVDVATLGDLSQTTGGSIYHYSPFNPAQDHEQLLNDLRWNVTRPQGLEAVMRVRTSAGLEVESYTGAFYKPGLNDIMLPAIDSDKAVVVKIQHLEKLQAGQEVYIQCALLYTTTTGHRRIRIHNLALPVTDVIGTVFKGADLDSHITMQSRRLAASMPGGTLASGRDLVTNNAVGVLYGYRRYCATSSSAVQLILPEALKLLPLYSLSLLKSPGLRVDMKPDERSIWVYHMLSLPCQRIIPMLYPRLIPLHKVLDTHPDGAVDKVPEPVVLSAEMLEIGGVYMLENGFEVLVYVDTKTNPALLQDLLGVSALEAVMQLPVQGAVVPRDGPFSKAVQELLSKVRLQRCAFMRLRLVRKGEPLEATFYSMLVEDKYNVGVGMSYVEYLCQVHRLIQNKMG